MMSLIAVKNKIIDFDSEGFQSNSSTSDAAEEQISENKIDVFINLKMENVNGYVKFKGETNLPDDYDLMFTISNNEHFRKYDSMYVNNGKFQTEDIKFDIGRYKVVIRSGVQSSDVKKAIGVNGSNLIGDLVKSDNGTNEVIFEKEIIINR